MAQNVSGDEKKFKPHPDVILPKTDNNIEDSNKLSQSSNNAPKEVTKLTDKNSPAIFYVENDKPVEKPILRSNEIIESIPSEESKRTIKK